jgi:hypothetical protein
LKAATRIDNSVNFFTTNDKPFGITFGQWTVRWWKWLLSCPKPTNPARDENGMNSSLNQHGHVWFLAGTFGEKMIPYRRCTIPHDKCILFPIINYELNFLENPEFTTENELMTNVKKDEDDITNVIAKVDAQKLRGWRVQSDPKLFYVDLPPENCLELPSGGIKIASDGYWVFLKPLRKGVHTIFFHASCSGGLRKCTAFYDLTIF